jgi:hypothetical protein
MATVATLPARIVGSYVAGEGPKWPTLDWYLDPLPVGQQTVTEIVANDRADRLEDARAVYRRLAEMRPSASEWIKARVSHGIADVFGADPVTTLAYDLLRRDLQLVSWA